MSQSNHSSPLHACWDGTLYRRPLSTANFFATILLLVRHTNPAYRVFPNNIRDHTIFLKGGDRPTWPVTVHRGINHNRVHNQHVPLRRPNIYTDFEILFLCVASCCVCITNIYIYDTSLYLLSQHCFILTLLTPSLHNMFRPPGPSSGVYIVSTL
jgi:hypothetical protein